jgi:hypothetical protein
MDARAQSLLERMLGAYRNCHSYRDAALQTTVFVAGARPWQRKTKRLELRTSARRPDRLRFAFTEQAIGPRSEWQRALIAIDARSARAWTTSDGARSFANAGDALTSLAGASGATSVLAPALWGGLYKDALEFARHNLGEPRCAGEEVLEDRICERLSGRTASGHEVDLWIERESGRLARVRRTTRGAANGSRGDRANDAESTTDFYGAFDVDVDETELAFDPPA